MAVQVFYNNLQITPTPLVSRTIQPIDYGKRFGQTEEISLSCSLTGLTTPAEVITRLTGIFSDQFKTLKVVEDQNLIYQWDNVILQEMGFSQSSLQIGGFVPYTAKFISYQTPSGITDPTNEYSFVQNEDGTVNVSHRISAKGIKTSIGALDNAVNFVKTFTGKNPYSFCAPTFIPNGIGVLLNIQESINRAEASYSVNETYKYTTGYSGNYIETTSLDINDSINQDYPSFDLSIKRKGSNLNDSVQNLKNSFTGADLNQILSTFGVNTSNVYRNSFSITQDSGANSLDIKASFLSGNAGDYSGYFDYVVSMDADLVTEQTEWKVDGEFICKGPLSHRRNRINLFKTANQSNSYIPYLIGLISGSALYNAFANFYITGDAIPTQLTIAENTGLATLKLGASFSDTDRYADLINPKYSIDMDASKWVYELLPAANIEGAYVLQDLQMKSQAKMKLNMDAGANPVKSSDLSNIYFLLTTVSGIYFENGFVINENVNSGVSDLAVSYEIIGHDKMATGLLTSKVAGNIAQNYTRLPLYKFGY